MKAVGLVLCSLLAGGTVAVSAGGQDARFRGGVELVALNVTVTDAREKPVTGLTQDNFIVYEDGVPQDVSFFATSRVPLDLALLLDTSASMSQKMTIMQEAAVGFVSTLVPGDRASIVDIKDTVKVLQPLGDDFDAARTAIRSTTARGGTALYNGIYMTLKELARKRGDDVRRQAIAVLSDGDDTASLVSFDDVMDVAKRAGVAVYTIALRSDSDVTHAKSSGSSSEAGYSMKALARETGARSFFPMEIGELAGVYGTIAEELAHQYALGYTPKNQARDGAYRRVAVQVAHVGGVRTRTRSGYISPEDRVARH